MRAGGRLLPSVEGTRTMLSILQIRHCSFYLKIRKEEQKFLAETHAGTCTQPKFLPAIKEKGYFILKLSMSTLRQNKTRQVMWVLVSPEVSKGIPLQSTYSNPSYTLKLGSN